MIMGLPGGCFEEVLNSGSFGRRIRKQPHFPALALVVRII